MAKKKVKKKTLSKAKTSKVLEKKTRKTSKLLIYSFVIFLVSLVLYYATTIDIIEAVFGFIAILSGAVVLLAIISEVVFYLLKRAGKK